MMRGLRRTYITISTFTCFISQLSGMSLYAADDDLDKYFEDYFLEEYDETPPAQESAAKPVEKKQDEVPRPVAKATPAVSVPPPQPVVLAPVQPPPAQEPLQQVVPAKELYARAQEMETAIAQQYSQQPKQPLLSSKDIAINDDDYQMSYLDSYIDEAPYEIWDFHNFMKEVESIDRDSIIEKTVNYLIGEEIEQPTIEIRGDEVLKAAPTFKTLKLCIMEATENHLPIEIAKEKVLMYRRKIRKAYRDLFPAVSGVISDKEYNVKEEADTREETDEVKMIVRQPIYQGGSLWNKVREEEANLRTAMAEYNKIFADLALEVSTAYFNLSKARTMLSYREDLFEKSNYSLSLSEEKFAANLISEIEHLNVQSQQSQLNHNLQQGREDIELAMLEIQKAMNIDLDVNIDVYLLDNYFDLMGVKDELMEQDNDGHAKSETIDEKKISELINMAYENRPEFVIGENKVRAKKYAEKVEKGKWLPQVSLFFELGRNRSYYRTQEADVAPRRWNDLYHGGIECSWNFFGSNARYFYDNTQTPPSPSAYKGNSQGTRTITNTFAVGLLDGLEQFSTTKEAEIATKEAILEFQLSEKDMVSEVKESFYNYNRAKIQMRSILKKIEYREKLVELAKHRSEINEIQISEYLQSEIDLVEERNTLYQAMIDYFIARASLNKAIGVSNFFDIEKLPKEVS
ncbi:MAG: TolC family protein [Candidatus Omnitrophica bacterium]|nr:TolC family protein [Candidatus Omnitrophota bacterium]